MLNPPALLVLGEAPTLWRALPMALNKPHGLMCLQMHGFGQPPQEPPVSSCETCCVHHRHSRCRRNAAQIMVLGKIPSMGLMKETPILS